MKKNTLTLTLLLFSLVSFGQYSRTSDGEMATSIIGGILALITIIVIWVIAARLKKLIEQQKQILKIQTNDSIQQGIIKGRTCVRCGEPHVFYNMVNKEECPACNLKYEPGYVIYNENGEINAHAKKFYEKKKEQVELLWEYVSEKK